MHFCLETRKQMIIFKNKMFNLIVDYAYNCEKLKVIYYKQIVGYFAYKNLFMKALHF